MTISPVPVTAYDSLASSDVSWLTCMWGSSGRSVLGFRGSHAEVTKCLTLFANLDIAVDDDGNETGDPVSPPTWLHDSLAYITTTPERVRRCLVLFFHCEILRLGEIPIEHHVTDDSRFDDHFDSRDVGLAPIDDYTEIAVAYLNRPADYEVEPFKVLPIMGGLTYETSYDEDKVARLARAYADRFIASRIRVSSFMPPPPQTLNIEHSLGHMVTEPNDRMLEELVEQEAKAS